MKKHWLAITLIAVAAIFILVAYSLGTAANSFETSLQTTLNNFWPSVNPLNWLNKLFGFITTSPTQSGTTMSAADSLSSVVPNNPIWDNFDTNYDSD